MASSNTIILSSSSPTSWITTTPPRDSSAAMSSSPGLPSPSQLFARWKPNITGGCRGIAVSAAAVTGFTSVSSLSALAKDGNGSTMSAQFAVVPQVHHPSQESLTTVINHGNQPAHEAVVAVQVRKPRAPRKKSTAMKKRLSEAIVRHSDGEESDITKVTLAKKPKAPRKKSTAGVKQLSEMIVRDGEIRDVLLNGVVSTKKPKAPRKKSIVLEKQTGAAVVHGCRSESAIIEITVVKKTRAKGTIEEGQTTIKKGKIVKPAASGDQGAWKSRKGDIKRKGHPETASEFVPVEDIGYRKTYEPLGLDMATMRRKSWTPVKESYRRAGDREAVSHDANSPLNITSSTSDTPPITGNGILLGSYSYYKDSEAAPARIIVPDTSGEAPTKRRKINFIDTPNYSSPLTKPIKKNKASKPKPQTITGKATAPFMPEDPATASPLLQYLAPQSIAEYTSTVPIDAFPKNPAASNHGRRCPAKPRKSNSVKLRALKVAPILLPPEEAMKAAADQDLLFGTSSQLIREDSPTFIRDLQEAIKASESLDALSDIINADSSVAAVETGPNVSRRTSTRNLWSEAARDSQGSLMEPEVIDLVGTLKAYNSTEQNTSTKPITKTDSVSKPSAQNTSWMGIDPFAEPILQLDTETILQGPAISETNFETANLVPSLARSVAEAALRSRPKSRSPTKKQKSPNPQADPRTDMPNFQDLTISELSKTISKYGFKPIKGKAAMVALLQKCWESKNRPALQSLPANLNVPCLGPNEHNITINKSKTPSPAKRKGRPPKAKNNALSIAEHNCSVPADPPTNPRGRPRKETLPSATIDAVETESIAQPRSTVLKDETISKAARGHVLPPQDNIEDLKLHPMQSPSRHPSPRSQPQALSHTTSATANILSSVMLSPRNPDYIYDKISQAITTFPPTHNPKNLTWHEKILLYDPIVLEDLAAWLNTEGLGRVGIDEEVGPITVRSWCEGRGVCCLWRENLRGGARKRY